LNDDCDDGLEEARQLYDGLEEAVAWLLRLLGGVGGGFVDALRLLLCFFRRLGGVESRQSDCVVQLKDQMA
jgi:hypothetical protein